VAYRLEADQRVGEEVRRLIDKQLAAAIALGERVGDSMSANEIHQARRHIKKVRALIRLVRPALGDRYKPMDRRLRSVSRLLGPIADGEAVVDALDRLGRRYSGLSGHTGAAIRAGLLARAARSAQLAQNGRTPRAMRRQLQAEQKRVQAWKNGIGGLRTIARGLECTARDARRAMALAAAHPTIENYHSWRRRVKGHWLQIRLIQERCGNRLRGDELRLERLDGVLGEYHNCVLLIQVLTDDALISRGDTARVVRLIRRFQAELRRKALKTGAAIYQEKPGALVKRVTRLWKLTRARRTSAPPTGSQVPWPEAA
jgi:CHAD domain-containing protein